MNVALNDLFNVTGHKKIAIIKACFVFGLKQAKQAAGKSVSEFDQFIEENQK